MKTMNMPVLDQDQERISAEARLNEYLAEERERKKLLDEKLCQELRAKKRDEGRTAAETRLNEYLAEERERKKLLEEKLSRELEAGKPRWKTP
jgi:hypothetical protein